MPTRHTHRKRTGRRWIGGTLVAVLIGLVGVAAFDVLSGRYQVRPVLSGSMRPGLSVGGIVITKRVPVTSLRVRDVVVLHRPDQPKELVVHRIISLTPGPSGLIVQTQGDANDVPDPWKVTLRGDTAYRVVYSVPLVGYAAVWVHNPDGRRTLMALGLLMVLGAAVMVARRRRPASGEEADDHLPDIPGPFDGDSDARAGLDLEWTRVGEPEASSLPDHSPAEPVPACGLPEMNETPERRHETVFVENAVAYASTAATTDARRNPLSARGNPGRPLPRRVVHCDSSGGL